MVELQAFQQAAVAAIIEETPRVTDPLNGAEAGTVTIYLDRKKVSVPLVPGETLLESARRAGLEPPVQLRGRQLRHLHGQARRGPRDHAGQ